MAHVRHARTAALLATAGTAALVTSLLGASPASAVAASGPTEVVRPSSLGTGSTEDVPPAPTDVWFVNGANTQGAGKATVVADPADTGGEVNRDGSLQLSVTAGTDKVQVVTLPDGGQRLGDVTSASYWTSADASGHEPAFQLEVLCNGTGGYATLNYEPADNTDVDGAAVKTDGTWQKWDVAAGQWWSTRTINPDGSTSPSSTDPGAGGLQGGSGHPFTLTQAAAICDAAGGGAFDYGVDLGSGPTNTTVGTDLLELNGRITDFAVDDGYRFAGANRLQTALDVSSTWADQSAEIVVLARQDSYPDALAGVPLAAFFGDPVLLTPSTQLDAAVEQEVTRVLKPSGTVVLMGGTAALSTTVEKRLRTVLGTNRVDRIAGANRFETALNAWTALRDQGSYNGRPVRTLAVVTGTNFPDALSAGAAMGTVNGGVLLSNGKTLPASVRSVVQYAASHGSAVYGIGGDGAAAAGSLASVTLVGKDRYATSALVADRFFGSAASTKEWGLATGLNFPDALAGGAYMAHYGPLLLTPPTALADPARQYLLAQHSRLSLGWVFGGTSVVSDPVGGHALNVAGGVDVVSPAARGALHPAGSVAPLLAPVDRSAVQRTGSGATWRPGPVR